jgi:hypothetical protein
MLQPRGGKCWADWKTIGAELSPGCVSHAAGGKAGGKKAGKGAKPKSPPLFKGRARPARRAAAAAAQRGFQEAADSSDEEMEEADEGGRAARQPPPRHEQADFVFGGGATSAGAAAQGPSQRRPLPGEPGSAAAGAAARGAALLAAEAAIAARREGRCDDAQTCRALLQLNCTSPPAAEVPRPHEHGPAAATPSLVFLKALDGILDAGDSTPASGGLRPPGASPEQEDGSAFLARVFARTPGSAPRTAPRAKRSLAAALATDAAAQPDQAAAPADAQPPADAATQQQPQQQPASVEPFTPSSSAKRRRLSLGPDTDALDALVRPLFLSPLPSLSPPALGGLSPPPPPPPPAESGRAESFPQSMLPSQPSTGSAPAALQGPVTSFEPPPQLADVDPDPFVKGTLADSAAVCFADACAADAPAKPNAAADLADEVPREIVEDEIAEEEELPAEERRLKAALQLLRAVNVNGATIFRLAEARSAAAVHRMLSWLPFLGRSCPLRVQQAGSGG